MMYCWYCHWGWPKPVADIYDSAMETIEKFGGDAQGAMHFGPAHCTWEDENFDTAETELSHFDDYITRWNTDYGSDFHATPTQRFSAGELVIVRWSLVELCKLPMELREPPQAFIDAEEAAEKDSNLDPPLPADYPPPREWEVRKR